MKKMMIGREVNMMCCFTHWLCWSIRDGIVFVVIRMHLSWVARFDFSCKSKVFRLIFSPVHLRIGKMEFVSCLFLPLLFKKTNNNFFYMCDWKKCLAREIEEIFIFNSCCSIKYGHQFNLIIKKCREKVQYSIECSEELLWINENRRYVHSIRNDVVMYIQKKIH